MLVIFVWKVLYTRSLYIGVLQVDNGSFQPYSAAVNKCYDRRLYSLKNSVSKQFSRGKHICVFVISQINSLKYVIQTAHFIPTY